MVNLVVLEEVVAHQQEVVLLLVRLHQQDKEMLED